MSLKPLPNPPIARAGATSPTRAGRSLLDASEKPLRRSPPGMPQREEEWPTLTPRKTSKSLAPENDGHQEHPRGSLNATSVRIGPVERFPVSDTLSHSKLGSDASILSQMASSMKEESEVSIASLASENIQAECSITSSNTVDAMAANIQHFDEFDDTSKDIRTVKHLPSLEAIEESPRADFEVKRLSISSLDTGPTLKIFRSAENVIMGTDSHDEDHPICNRRRNSHHVLADNDFHQQRPLESPTETCFQQQHFERVNPLQDMTNLVLDPSRLAFKEQGCCINCVENNKNGNTNTEDVNYSLSTNHLRRLSTKPKTLALRKTESFSPEDPFFDRHPHYEPGKNCSIASAVQLSVPKQRKEATSAEGESRIFPLLGRKHPSSDRQVKDNSAQRKLTPPAVLRKEAVPSFRGNSNIKPTREVSDPAAGKATTVPDENLTEQLSTSPAQAVGLEIDKSHVFPPRSSSRIIPAKYAKPAKASPGLPLLVHESREAEYSNPQNDDGSFVRDASAHVDLGNGESKRGSIAQESSKSRASSSKGVISNIRGFFHRHTSSSASTISAKQFKRENLDKAVADNGGALSTPIGIHPTNRPTRSSADHVSHPEGRSRTGVHIERPATPSIVSPVPNEISATMATAMQLLDSVRMEENSPQKERRLELGTIMVQAITQAKEAEKAMEEAKHAARKADVAHILCKKSVREIALWVERWREETGSE